MEESSLNTEKERNCRPIDGKIFFMDLQEEILDVDRFEFKITQSPDNEYHDIIGGDAKTWYCESVYTGKFRCRKTGITTKSEKTVTKIIGREYTD